MGKLPVVYCMYFYIIFRRNCKEDTDDTLRGPRDAKCCLGNLSVRHNRLHGLEANHSPTINHN